MFYLASFFTSFVYVGLRAFQQLNVVHHKIKWIPLVSLLMGFCDVFLIALVVKSNFSILVAIAIGLGGAAGSILSMMVHKRMRSKQ